MTMDSLREIRIAEEKADKIRADAEKTARERIAAAHAQADELVTRAEKEAHAEAAAGSNSDEAVKMIYWEIVEKCLRA